MDLGLRAEGESRQLNPERRARRGAELFANTVFINETIRVQRARDGNVLP